jgi:hypothetical protein
MTELQVNWASASSEQQEVEDGSGKDWDVRWPRIFRLGLWEL